MTYEKSCGAVIHTMIDGVPHYVLAQSLEGRWGFPKGHMERDETEEQTALREISEEVRLRVNLLPGFRTVDEYPLSHKEGIIKQVVFFCAEYDHQDILPQAEELLSAALVPYEEALAMLDFESSRRILREAHAFLLSR